MDHTCSKLTYYHRTVCSCTVTADDQQWAPLIPSGHLVTLKGGTGLRAERRQDAIVDDGAVVAAMLVDAYYPPMQVQVQAETFQRACTPAEDPGEFSRSIVKLCDHAKVDQHCTGCWVRWWMRGAHERGITLPPRVILGAQL